MSLSLNLYFVQIVVMNIYLHVNKISPHPSPPPKSHLATSCLNDSFLTSNTGTGMRIGTGVPGFQCTSGENVTVDTLCDGNQDCMGGDDETTPLCESEPLLCKF